MAIDEALLRQFAHQVAEALAFLAETVAHRHAHVVEEELGRVLRVHGRPCRACGRGGSPRASPRPTIRLTPLAPAAGSVLHTTMIRSAIRPLLMKVLLPLMTYSSPSRTAVVRTAFRSLPVPGSVMAMARMISPVQRRAATCCFCSSVPSAQDVRRDDVRVHAEAETADARARRTSSPSTAAWPKSPPPPPYSVGQRCAQQAFAAGLEPGLAVDLAGLVPGLLARQAFALEEAAHRLAVHLMVVSEDVAGHVHGFVSCGNLLGSKLFAGGRLAPTPDGGRVQPAASVPVVGGRLAAQEALDGGVVIRRGGGHRLRVAFELGQGGVRGLEGSCSSGSWSGPWPRAGRR